jgi:hypothetical protein
LSSSVEFGVLDEQFPMAVFPSPWPAIYTARNGKGFVDDLTPWEMSLAHSRTQSRTCIYTCQSPSMGMRSPLCRRCP